MGLSRCKECGKGKYNAGQEGKVESTCDGCPQGHYGEVNAARYV